MKIQREFKDNFTVIHNEIIDNKALSPLARLIAITLLRLPDNWQLTISGLATYLGIGRTSASSGLNALEKCGYLRRKAMRDKAGKFVRWEFDIADEAQSEWIDKAEKSETKRKFFFSWKMPSFNLGTKININNVDADNETLSVSNIADKQKVISAIEEQIEYEALCNEYSSSLTYVDAIRDVIVDVQITKEVRIRISKQSLLTSEVQTVFNKITKDIASKTIKIIELNGDKIKRKYLTAYIRTTLYNLTQNETISVSRSETEIYADKRKHSYDLNTLLNCAMNSISKIREQE